MRDRVQNVLEQVELADALLACYPGELSGGMKKGGSGARVNY